MQKNFYLSGRRCVLSFVFVLAMLIANTTNAQWTYKVPITITNNENQLVVNWQQAIYFNTATPIGNGHMLANGNDIRFSTDCAGTTLLPYYIDSGLNSAQTKIWVKIDSLQPLANRTIFLLYGNPAAGAASTLNTFNGPFSSTNQVASGGAGGATNSQRGFRFSPKYNIIVTSFGKREPNGTARYVTLFNWTTQALIHQTQVSGAAGTYSYATLTSPLWLTKNTIYTLQLYQGAADGYYFGTSSQINPALTYLDMRYCNSCTQNTFPTNVLNNYHYGYPDLEFYSVDTNNITSVPTHTVGTATTGGTITIATQPANSGTCEGSNTSFSVTASNAVTYQWQVNTGSGFNNVSNAGVYSGATTATLNITGATVGMNTYTYRCITSATCATNVTTNTATLTVNAYPVITSHPSNSSISLGNNTSFAAAATGTGLTYQWQLSTNNGVSWSNISNAGIYNNTTTNTLAITSATLLENGNQYRCVATTGSICSVPSNAAILTVTSNPPAIVSHPQNISSVCPGNNVSFSVTATNTTMYQWQVNNGSGWSNITNGGIYSGATTATLSLTNINSGINSYSYRCIASGSGSPATSNAATITINTLPAITTHPVSSTICEGASVSYTVVATGSGLSYQWQGSVNGTTWNNLSNTSYFSGVNTAILLLSNTNSGAYSMYRCIVSGTCAPSVTSNVATLTVQTQPTISLNPSTATICDDQNISFQVGATGSNLNYQWQVSTNGGVSYSNVTNGGVYSGATTFNLNLTNPPVSFSGYRYRCVVSGSCPTTKTSNAAILTINSRVVINTQPPAALTLCSGDNTSLSVAATGTNVSYRWYIQTGSTYTALNNGGFYSGVTNATLNITGITAAPNTQTYTYRCIATGTCNAVTSNAAVIVVNAKPAVTANPVSVTRCDSTNNLSFSVTATGTNVTYQWQLSTNGGTTWANLNNNSTYQATTTSTLLLPNVYFYMNGYRFRCVVSGTCAPAATSGSATLTVNQLVLPVVTISANNTDICAGQSVMFTSSQVNGGAATYQWKKNNVNVGTGTTYTTTTLADNDIVICHMTSNATCPSPKVVVSNPITMKVTQYSTPTIAITSNMGTSWCTGKPIEFNATITNGGANPTYVWKLNNVVAGTNSSNLALPFINNGDKVVCSLVSSLKCFTPNPAVSNTITMTVNLTTKSSIVIAANPDSVICDKTEVTMFAFYTNSGTSPKFQWMQNGMDIPGETGGTLKTTGIANGDFINCRFISSATCVFPEISNPVTFSVGNILDPKVNVAVSYNGNNSYTFTAIAVNGGANPAYQWYRNFNKLAGETGATYTTSILDKTDRVYVEMASSEPCVNPQMELIQSRVATTGVADLGAAFKDLGLYPNPNTGQFTISGELNQPIASKEVVVKITNALGQTVYTQVFPASGSDISLPVTLRETVANGMYTVNITIDNETTNIRFVLSR